MTAVDVGFGRLNRKVHAVISGADLELRGCAWMRTMSGDVQAMLATDKVRGARPGAGTLTVWSTTQAPRTPRVWDAMQGKAVPRQ